MSWFAWQKEVLLMSTILTKKHHPSFTDWILTFFFFFQMHWAFRWIFQATLQIRLLTRKVTKTSAFIQTSKVILFYRWLTEAVCLTNHWLHLHNLVHLQQFFKLLERIHWKRKMAVQNWRSFKIPSALLQSSPFVIFHSFCMIATLLSTIGIHC